MTTATTAMVILSQREQEYLLHAVEAALPVDNARQFFLWTQGPLQALVPHQVMVALHFDSHDRLLHMECQHSVVLDAFVRQRLAGEDGLAVRLARDCRRRDWRSLWFDADHADADANHAVADLAAAAAAPPPLQQQLPELKQVRALGFDNLALHATSHLPGGSSVVVLLGLAPGRPARHAYFLTLLLPQLHMMLQHLAQAGAAARNGGGSAGLARPVSAREAEILHWVHEGKSNDEIGQILGISGLTVKNHLQRLYRLLGVSNRTHAIARGAALRLFDQQPQLRARHLARAA